MKNYQDSDYALNKYSEGMVYRFADKIVEVTLADFLAENPTLTADDFLKLKAASDSMYLEQVRSEDLQTRRTAPLEEVEGTLLASEPGAEYTFMDAQEEAERQKQRLALASRALAKLTGIQRRRYLLHVGKGLTTREIAAVERVAQQVVDRSILAAKKKIKKFLAETQ